MTGGGVYTSAVYMAYHYLQLNKQVAATLDITNADSIIQFLLYQQPRTQSAVPKGCHVLRRSHRPGRIDHGH
jgi:hypothetical protein